MSRRSVFELCAGGGGQALGLELAGFECVAAVDNDDHACATLKANRPAWQVLGDHLKDVRGREFRGVDLLAAGIPCPPFSIAGKQLGPSDDRDLFPEALRIIAEAKPGAVLIENVPGFASARFEAYRSGVIAELKRLGYEVIPGILNASDFGVPQVRSRFVLVGLPRAAFRIFRIASSAKISTVGDSIGDLMGARGWRGASAWQQRAQGLAPTLVGGSKKHGGPDLGPTRAKREWRKLGVDAMGLANEAPGEGFPTDGLPRLTVRMSARIQGFPDEWKFVGGKTAAYRQVGNAFPPPVAEAVGMAIRAALDGRKAGLLPMDPFVRMQAEV